MSVKLLTYQEHEKDAVIDLEVSSNFSKESYENKFPKKHRSKDTSLPCFSISQQFNDNETYTIKTGYFIGLDWIETHNSALYIAPKLNDGKQEVDFISMLLSALKHPSVTKEIEELFVVKWNSPTIAITKKQDLLTPFLIVEYLSLLKQIVRKGLKKSYYQVEQNLQGKVKGKVQVTKTIKQNLTQNKNLFTYCSFEEFGENNKENRLLKKALQFIKHYLPTYAQLTDNKELQNIFNYINPAFIQVSDKIEITEIKHTKTNVFYKEYEPALYLAKLILKRFGYNISNTVKSTIQSPPFWIDMSKLFELYVLGLLKDKFQNKVKFQFKHYGNELDYLLSNEDYQMVIDAKYKIKYIDGKHDKDIRQVSGYARLKHVYKALNKNQGEVIDCLIIHPDQDGYESLINVNLKETEVNHYYDVYKVGVKLPIVK